MSSKQVIKEAVTVLRDILKDVFVEGREDAFAALDTLDREANRLRKENRELADQLVAAENVASAEKLKRLEMAETWKSATDKRDADFQRAMKQMLTREKQASFCMLAARVRRPVKYGLLQTDTPVTKEQMAKNRDHLIALIGYHIPSLSPENPNLRPGELVGLRGRDLIRFQNPDELTLLGAIVSHLHMLGHSVCVLQEEHYESHEQLVDDACQRIVMVRLKPRVTTHEVTSDHAKYLLDLGFDPRWAGRKKETPP